MPLGWEHATRCQQPPGSLGQRRATGAQKPGGRVYTPPLPSRSCRRRQTPWRASRLQTEDGRTPPRRAAPAHSAGPRRSPTSGRQPRAAIGACGRANDVATNEAPRSGRGLGRPTRGRGRAGRPPHGDVRPGSRRVAMEAAFPSLRASGGRPLPFNFFLNGGRGRCRAVPAPVIPRPLPTLGLGLPFRAAHAYVAWRAAFPVAAPPWLGTSPLSPRLRCVRFRLAQWEGANGRSTQPGWGSSRTPGQGCDPRTPGLGARQRPVE